MHPAVLDLAFQSVLATKFKDKSIAARFEIPLQIDEIRVFNKLQPKMFALAQNVEEIVFIRDDLE